MAGRTVRKQYRAMSDDIGDLRTQRPLPNDEIDYLDPFLFLNHHGPQVYPPGNRGLPFGPHPHRGFETVTFIVKGSLAHRDTAGHESVIDAGGVQWMTAGRGVEHSELSPDEFLRRGGPLEILQLWINLPARLKMTEPRYIGLQRDAIPAERGDRWTIRRIAGEGGAMQSLTGVVMMTIEWTGEAPVLHLDAPRERHVFLYVVRGTIKVAGVTATEFHLVDVDDDGDAVDIEAVSEALVIFGHAEPLNEPVVAHGPFVMNTREEILQAFRDYRMGEFR